MIESLTTPSARAAAERRAAAAARLLDTVDALEATIAEVLALDLRCQELQGARRPSCRSVSTYCRNLGLAALGALPGVPAVNTARRAASRAAILSLSRSQREGDS